MITSNDLIKLGASKENAEKFAPYFEKCFKKYRIDNPKRIAHFLAQVFHESGKLRYVRELASGEAYEGRKDLGNTQPGDGKKFRGRGILQITGRTNYSNYGKYIDVDLIKNPELLESPEYAVDSAGWFWTVYKKLKSGKNLNDYADLDNAIICTYLINGGFNGFLDRLQLLKKAYEIVGITDGKDRLNKVIDHMLQNLTKNRTAGSDKVLFATYKTKESILELKKALKI